MSLINLEKELSASVTTRFCNLLENVSKGPAGRNDCFRRVEKVLRSYLEDPGYTSLPAYLKTADEILKQNKEETEVEIELLRDEMNEMTTVSEISDSEYSWSIEHEISQLSKSVDKLDSYQALIHEIQSNISKK